MFIIEVAEAALLFLALVALAAYLDRRDLRLGRWPEVKVVILRRAGRSPSDLSGEAPLSIVPTVPDVIRGMVGVEVSRRTGRIGLATHVAAPPRVMWPRTN